MQIRTRLTLQFLLIFASIMILASVSIYVFLAKYQQQIFSDRLRARARVTTNLLLEARLNPVLLGQIERNYPVTLTGERVIILTENNDTVYSTDFTNEIEITQNILENVKTDRQVSFKQGIYTILGSLYKSDQNYIILAAAIDAEGKHHLEQLRLILYIVCIASVLIIAVAGWFYSGRALKPITDVVKKVDNITVTSLNLRIDEGNGKDEIGRLVATFNRMLGRLEKSFLVQKDFIANASHELRTPLTAINGQLEVLSLKDRSNDEYKTAIKSVLEDTKRITELANLLLLIARTSAEGPNFNNNVRIDEILWETRDALLRFNKHFHINILMDSMVDASQVTITGDDALLKVAATNLIENGCKYSENNTVNIQVKSLPGSVQVVFRDNGIGIPETDRDKVFEPFYRSKNAKEYPGTGLGLSIVRQIIENHNGSILINSQEGRGTDITITLPVRAEMS